MRPPTAIGRQALTALDYGTELPGARATRSQLQLATHRYALVACCATDKDVLDAACGAGQGLPVVARTARTLVAGDLTRSNLDRARRVAPRVPLVHLDAERLPFRDRSFDLIVILEAIYYLPDAERFLRAAWRALRNKGRVLVGTVNPVGRDFGRPPVNSTRFFDSRELQLLLGVSGFAVEVFGAFPESARPTSRAASFLRGMSARLGIPWPPAARWAIRRALHGPISRYPASLEQLATESTPLVRVPMHEVDRIHRVLYAIGAKQPS